MVTGTLTLASGVALVPQLGLFAVVTVLSVLVARRWTTEVLPDETLMLNDPAARLIDSIVIVEETVNADHGRVRVADGTWPARGDPARPGDKVRVVAVENGCLIVTRRRRSGQGRGNR
nr:NfeD family protein [Sphingomonas quercus]